jgi:hypothetical protein
MATWRQYRIAFLLLICLVILQAFLYPHLPDPMPIHWDVHGNVDGYLAKPWGPWLATLIFVPVIGLMTLMPVVSPTQFPMQPFNRVYRLFLTALAAFAVWLVLLTDAIAMGVAVSLPQHLISAVGVLYVVLGNWMGKITRNFFFGIRTPWTLADAVVWDRTHRLAGPLVVLAGLSAIGAALLRPLAGVATLLIGSALAFGIPVIYSWRISARHSAPVEDTLE